MHPHWPGWTEASSHRDKGKFPQDNSEHAAVSDFTERRCFLLVWGLGFLGNMGVVLLFDFGFGATAVLDQGSYQGSN